ncbi:uncharacterized protein LOC134141671 [Rhea pennata]|uniref:uncharacterized protein LOC134141671 n=1 Tax=Rhea pennata TaxID=8795 RepID=UPI002E256217
MDGDRPLRGPKQCPCGRRISVTDEHERCVLCLGASHSLRGCWACARMAPYAARLRQEHLHSLLQAHPGGGAVLPPRQVSGGAAKGKSAKRRRELAFPAESQDSFPVLQPGTQPCPPAKPGKAAPLKDPVLLSLQTESPPHSQTCDVPDNTCSPQKKHCQARTKQNLKALSPPTLKPPPSGSLVSKSQLHPLHSVLGPEHQSGESQWQRMLSDLAKSILLIAEAASKTGEPPPELATKPLVSPSAAGMLLEPKIVSGPPEPTHSPNKVAISVPMPPLPVVPAQPLSPPSESVSSHPTSPSVSCNSSSWKPDVTLRDDDSCCISSREDDLIDFSHHFRAEDRQDNISTSENLSFPQFLERLAKLVGFHLIPFQESTGSLIDRYLDQKPSCNRVAMPLHPILDKLVKKVWQTPHTVPPVSKEIERKYILLEDAAGYVSQPAHESMVVEAAMAREKTSCEHSAAPQNPDLRRLDSFGQRVYQSAAAALRVVDYQIYMARGQVELWKKISALAKPLPRDQQQELQNIVLEGMDLARHQVRAAFDAGETVARAAASGVDARRSAWLQASGFHEEVQTKLENLPYTGENLFGEQVEATLQRAKERQATLRFLRSVYCPSAPRSGVGKGKAPLHKPAFTSTVGFKGVQCPSGKGAPLQ